MPLGRCLRQGFRHPFPCGKAYTMGEANNVLNAYMNRPDRLRAVLEYYLGEKLPESWQFEEEDGFYTVRSTEGRMSFRQRDRITRVRAGAFSFLLGLENQQAVNLIYPWRLMELDCRAYGLQIERLQEKNSREKEAYEGGDDFLYRYRQGDFLEPVLILTLYWGRKKWDRPLSLEEMTRIREFAGTKDVPLKLCGLFGDYKAHLISMRDIPDTELQKMGSDLKYVLGIMKCTRARKKYEAFLRANQEYFRSIPKSAVDVIDVCTNIKNVRKYFRFTVNEKGEEVTDMCKAWDDSRKTAEKQGVKQGETRLADLIARLLEEGRVEDARLAAKDKDIRKQLYREYGIVKSTV